MIGNNHSVWLRKLLNSTVQVHCQLKHHSLVHAKLFVMQLLFHLVETLYKCRQFEVVRSNFVLKNYICDISSVT